MRPALRALASVLLAATALAGCTDGAEPPATAQPGPTPAAPGVLPVVVATFDTGTNPFHPCWQRAAEEDSVWLSKRRGLDAVPVRLAAGDDYGQALEASADALDAMATRTLHAIAGTSLLAYDTTDAPGDALVDTDPHGAQASSQIGCPGFGTAPEAYVLVLDIYGSSTEEAAELVQWVAAQAWIDVVHFNIQDIANQWWAPLYDDIGAVVGSGKMVVVAGGNFYGPGETSGSNSIPGILIAGANDNGGWTSYAYTDPHVVMDGADTVAAEGAGVGNASFGGTSSASPRTSGYVAHVLGLLRTAYNVTEPSLPEALLALPPGASVPAEGPLADGKLTAAELHEVVRKTADPNPHDSRFDGGTYPDSIPQPVDLPNAFYPKMGYGEVSEHTWDRAVAVTMGAEPMPARPLEDQAFLVAETARGAVWQG